MSIFCYSVTCSIYNRCLTSVNCRVDGSIPSALVYKVATASTSDALSIALFNELHTNLVAVLYAVICDGIAVLFSDFLVTYQSVGDKPSYAFLFACSFLVAFKFARFFALELLVITTVPTHLNCILENFLRYHSNHHFCVNHCMLLL